MWGAHTRPPVNKIRVPKGTSVYKVFVSTKHRRQLDIAGVAGYFFAESKRSEK